MHASHFLLVFLTLNMVGRVTVKKNKNTFFSSSCCWYFEFIFRCPPIKMWHFNLVFGVWYTFSSPSQYKTVHLKEKRCHQFVFLMNPRNIFTLFFLLFLTWNKGFLHFLFSRWINNDFFCVLMDAKIFRSNRLLWAYKKLFCLLI